MTFEEIKSIFENRKPEYYTDRISPERCQMIVSLVTLINNARDVELQRPLYPDKSLGDSDNPTIARVLSGYLKDALTAVARSSRRGARPEFGGWTTTDEFVDQVIREAGLTIERICYVFEKIHMINVVALTIGGHTRALIAHL